MSESQTFSGPLSGLRVIELAGLGPGPFAAMLLADLGADIIRIERETPGLLQSRSEKDLLSRGRRAVYLNLKDPDHAETCRKLISRADALIEGFRPGVMEKLGLGPDVCLADNPKLVYGRMTGWGQTGPMARAAGHDINYLALSGALFAMGDADRPPTPPLNLVADFGGGGMFLAFGIVSAVLSARSTGVGQVVDAAMVDGCAALTVAFHGMMRLGFWNGEQRGVNLLDGAAHFYSCYACKDGGYVSVGAIEPQFYAILLEKLGIDNPDDWPQFPASVWPRLKRGFAEIFMTKTRDEWCEVLEGTDACFAPVLSLVEAANHPHNQSRQTFRTLFGESQPGPAPRFSETPGGVARPAPIKGESPQDLLEEWSR